MGEERIEDRQVGGLEQVAQESLRHLVRDLILLHTYGLVDELSQELDSRILAEQVLHLGRDLHFTGTNYL